jgi:hypothetical protein
VENVLIRLRCDLIHLSESLQKYQLALSGQDVDATKNNRIQVKARDITVDGFNLVYITWTDSIVYSIWTTWTAIGLKP